MSHNPVGLHGLLHGKLHLFFFTSVTLFILIFMFSFFLSFLGWGETESTWYVGHYWPTVPVPVDSWWVWSCQWNENWQEKPQHSEKTCLSATLSTTNPTWPDLGSNTDHRGGKPATNHLSYGTAFRIVLHIKLLVKLHFALFENIIATMFAIKYLF
jgi:hypothetical protein